MSNLSLPAPPNLEGQRQLLYNPYQQAFLKALDQKTAAGKWAFNRLSLFAGRRGGKTKIGGLATVTRAQIPNQMIWVCGPTYPDLNDFVMPAVFEFLPVDWIADYKASFQTLILKNGTKIAFRSLDDPNKGRGPSLDFAWLDETRKIQQLAWDTILPALADRKGQAIFTTTPNGFDWCHDRLFLPASNGDPGFWACQYKTIDNPFIDREEIEALRKQMDPLFFAQEFEADFITFQGRIYNIENAILRTDDKIREVIPEWPRISPERRTIVGLDPGADHPFAGILLVATERGMVAIAEHLVRNKPVVEHVRGIQRMLAAFNPDKPFVPDSYAIDRSQRQTLIELAQYSIICRQAENEVVAGIRRVQSWLEAGQLFFIESLVPETIKQMRSHRWAENRAPDGQWRKEAVFKENDDLPDAVRYALMTWPELPARDEKPSGGMRDVSDLPPEIRWALERSLELNRRERGEDDEDEGVSGLLGSVASDPIGEFYGAGRQYYEGDE